LAKAGAPSGPGPEHDFLAQLLLPLDLGQEQFVPIVGTVHAAGPQLCRQTIARPNLRAVHVQHYPLRGIDGFCLGDRLSVHRGQTREISFLRQQFCLE
jgi:hypothetical protein